MLHLAALADEAGSSARRLTLAPQRTGSQSGRKIGNATLRKTSAYAHFFPLPSDGPVPAFSDCHHRGVWQNLPKRLRGSRRRNLHHAQSEFAFRTLMANGKVGGY